MSSGLYSRVFVEVDGNTIFAARYNSEHDNHITNANPSSHGGFSDDVTQMQLTADPGEVGTESLAASLADELKRIRFAIKEIKGTSNWYPTPVTNLSSLATVANQLAIGLEFEGNKGGASSTTDVLAKFINQGGIINALSLVSADVAAADFDSTNKKFGTYSYILGAGNILAYPGWYNNPIKGSISCWYRNLSAGDYIAYNPLLGIELFLDSVSGRQTALITEKTAATESTKTTNQVQGSSTRSGVAAFHNATMKWRCNDENGASTDLLEQEYDGVDEGTQLATQDLDIVPGDGGIWFIGAKKNRPTWTHFYAASGLPTAHSSPWTSNGTPNATVSAGVLNIATAAGTTGFFSKTGAPLTGVNLANFTMEIKTSVVSVSQQSAVNQQLYMFNVRDDSMDRGVELHFWKDHILLCSSGSTTISWECQVDMTQSHIFTLTTSGSPDPTMNLYIDGMLVYSRANNIADATANDTIAFGDQVAAGDVNCNIEWVGFVDTVTPPIAVSAGGNIDSFGVVSAVIDDATIASLQSNQVTQVFGTEPNYGVTLPRRFTNQRTTGVTNTSAGTYTALDSTAGAAPYYIAGDGVTEFEFMYSNSFVGTGTGVLRMAIDIDSDFLGAAGSGAFADSAMRMNMSATEVLRATDWRQMVLPVGLHKVQPCATVSANAADWDSNEQHWLRSIVKNGRLA